MCGVVVDVDVDVAVICVHALIVDNRTLPLFWRENLANLLRLKDVFNLDTDLGAQKLHLLHDRVS